MQKVVVGHMWPAGHSLPTPVLEQRLKYEVCPKSNKTGVIKTLVKNIEIYQSQIPSK